MRLSGSGFRKFAFILFGIFSLAVLVSVFHHHEDGRFHEACPLCVFIVHHSDITLQDDQPVFLCDCNLLVSSESCFTFLLTFHSPFLIRAPPA
jgi:hypothetical protein